MRPPVYAPTSDGQEAPGPHDVSLPAAEYVRALEVELPPVAALPEPAFELTAPPIKPERPRRLF